MLMRPPLATPCIQGAGGGWPLKEGKVSSLAIGRGSSVALRTRAMRTHWPREAYGYPGTGLLDSLVSRRFFTRRISEESDTDGHARQSACTLQKRSTRVIVFSSRAAAGARKFSGKKSRCLKQMRLNSVHSWCTDATRRRSSRCRKIRGSWRGARGQQQRQRSGQPQRQKQGTKGFARVLHCALFFGGKETWRDLALSFP